MDITSIRKSIENNGVVIGTCVTETNNRQIGRIFANFGFDFLIIEREHGFFDLETVSFKNLEKRADAGPAPIEV